MICTEVAASQRMVQGVNTVTHDGRAPKTRPASTSAAHVTTPHSALVATYKLEQKHRHIIPTRHFKKPYIDIDSSLIINVRAINLQIVYNVLF